MKKAEGNAFWKHPRGWLRVIAATLIGLYLLAALFIIALRFVVIGTRYPPIYQRH